MHKPIPTGQIHPEWQQALCRADGKLTSSRRFAVGTMLAAMLVGNCAGNDAGNATGSSRQSSGWPAVLLPARYDIDTTRSISLASDSGWLGRLVFTTVDSPVTAVLHVRNRLVAKGWKADMFSVSDRVLASLSCGEYRILLQAFPAFMHRTEMEIISTLNDQGGITMQECII